jgi:hypothetical protein
MEKPSLSSEKQDEYRSIQWIYVAHSRDQWKAIVKTVKKLRVLRCVIPVVLS